MTARGRLRVYLGAAPGVGKTVAMLSEGLRRRSRGTDVVVGIVEDHGRAHTAAAVADLSVLPRLVVRHRGVELAELDVDAVLERRPEVVLVDELAHSNAPGSAREKRWQDVHALLDAGIDVITTVNVQHLESLNDVVAAITGVRQRETVPDSVVRSADAIELVDMSPQALRRRMAHGHIYPAERIDTALGNYFREGNLTALRELALLWLADRVEEGLERYRSERGITGTWAARERIVVALTGGPEGAMLLRRGARIAGRVAGRTLIAVHVVRADGAARAADPAELEKQRLLVEKLGGSLQLVVGDDIAAAVLDFARSVDGTQIVVGASTHGRIAQLVRPSTLTAIVRDSGDVDVHVVTHPAAGARRRGRSLRRDLAPRPRTVLVWAAALLVPVVLAAALLPFRSGLGLSSVLLVFLVGVLANGLIGGAVPATVGALVAGVLANLLYTPPIGSLTIAAPENVFALAVFVAVGATVASIVDRSALRARAAARGRAEAQLLAAVVTDTVTADDAVLAVLDRARVGFGMGSVTLREVDTGRPVQVSGPDPAGPPDLVVPAGRFHELALHGRPLPAADQALVDVFAVQAAVAVDRRDLARQAGEAHRLRQADAVRTAVLAALSHDLRTPLATIKAALAGLRTAAAPAGRVPGAGGLSGEDRRVLLGSAADAADQLDAVLTNLLDLSRLHTGVLTPIRRPVSVDEVVHGALVGVPAGSIRDDIPDDLPLLDTDAGLLERVLANIVSNAVRHTPAGRPVRLCAGRVQDGRGGGVQIRVVDHGPGVPEKDRPALFTPFQRLGDVPAGTGLGLGLAVARGLADAVDAVLEVEDTPGGGLTVMVTVPVAATRPSPAPVPAVEV
ncbi:sensor histidine kinase [Nakamurella endophytica]|uniref:histidine kinase n=1 Tax=Nakamurella endophytica TaxID=1748367 RepID=A0A917WMC2_9ACTN|nr:ATP-binding protein [Nakamurella endophytica]GGM14967.1 sensor histidine kinase [Nakamurella endophytica]